MIAQARDGSSSVHMWDMYYDATHHGIILDTYRSSGSDEIFSGNNTLPANTWTKVEVQYTATTGGGARLLLNGATQNSWRTNGNYSRTANLQRLQLWNDGANQVDFDDVRVAAPTPAGATVPGAPTGVTGTPRDRAVDLTWTAPSLQRRQRDQWLRHHAVRRLDASDGDRAQLPDHEHDGRRPDQRHRVHVHGRRGERRGHRSRLRGVRRDHAVDGGPAGRADRRRRHRARRCGDLAWTAPTSDGGSPITGYVSPRTSAGPRRAPILTGSTPTCSSSRG